MFKVFNSAQDIGCVVNGSIFNNSYLSSIRGLVYMYFHIISYQVAAKSDFTVDFQVPRASKSDRFGKI